VATLAVTRRHDLTDRQWAALAPLLPATSTGRPEWEKRRLIDGIRWRIRIGAPWRDVPAEYAWPTIYGLFRRWQSDGTWERILAALQAHGDAQDRIDGTVNAAAARIDGHLQKEPPGGVQNKPAENALGRSRGGLTAKTHLAPDFAHALIAGIVDGLCPIRDVALPSKSDQDARRKAKGSRRASTDVRSQLYRLRHAVENGIAPLRTQARLE